MNDPISQMRKEDIEEACLEILSWNGNHIVLDKVFDACLVGLMIAKLQEWECVIRWHYQNSDWMIVRKLEGACCEKSLQVAFLRTAQALGHWRVPEVKEEHLKTIVMEWAYLEDLRKRVEALEKRVQERDDFLKNNPYSNPQWQGGSKPL